MTGPLGWATDAVYTVGARHGRAYMESFDRRIPPSLHIGQNRHHPGMIIPVAERCLEDAPKRR